MKKILALVSLLTLAAACATAPSGNKDVPTNSNGNANKSADVKATAPPSEADIIAKEKAAWDAFRKKDADAFGKLMATDYIEVTDAGVMDKATSIAGMKDFDLTDVTFADWKMLPVDIDAVIIMYTATLKGTYKGKDVPPGPYHEASAYVNRNGEWLAIYYQETPSEKMPPAPTAKKTPASSPAAPAKPAETGPDPIANEKIVWDCFKTKNWDGFASLLAPDFKEVEADGVFDKTGSVKALQEMAGDMSMFELSDWKALSFDDDAKLVTYTVTAKGPKPMKDYHSTIWVKRDGKWLGLYHQGTPEMTAPAAKPEK